MTRFSITCANCGQQIYQPDGWLTEAGMAHHNCEVPVIRGEHSARCEVRWRDVIRNGVVNWICHRRCPVWRAEIAAGDKEREG